MNPPRSSSGVQNAISHSGNTLELARATFFLKGERRAYNSSIQGSTFVYVPALCSVSGNSSISSLIKATILRS